ncbi:MAG: hypothetical protein PHI97_14980 [Desulfobulbus sp.]|nr:hypothetical protein [Desulfobulbus sp.]
MELGFLDKIFDPYERKARLYPAFLTLIPILAFVVGQYGFTLKLETGTLGVLSTLGVFYLAASIARELGKRLENSLFDEWGGKPTTQVLRHKDKRIDPITKARYHTFLSEHMGITFPSKEEEDSNPVAADEIYQSATKWLLDRTRDQKIFELLFHDNIAFGFRRNCLGLKPFAIIIAASMLSWPLLSNNVVTTQGVDFSALHGLSIGVWGSLGISSLMLLVWVFFFTKRTAKTAAFGYADMLLRSCDLLPKKQRL